MIARATAPEIRGEAFGLRQSLDTLGAVFGPLLAILILGLTYNDFQLLFWIAFVPGVLDTIVLVRIAEEPQGGAAPLTRVPLTKADLTALGRAFWWIAFGAALLTFGRGAKAFLVLRAENLGTPIWLVPIVFVIMNAVYAAAAYPVGWLSDRMDRRRLLALGIVVLIGSDLALAIAERPWVGLAGVVLWGLHFGLTQGVLATLVVDSAPEPLRGTAFGVFSLLYGFALVTSGALGGLAWDIWAWRRCSGSRPPRRCCRWGWFGSRRRRLGASPFRVRVGSMSPPKVILVVFDGLRPDMVVPELAPNLVRFADGGSRFPLSRAVFPTETRVNTAALITGCRPARHGIVANQFHAPDAVTGRPLNTGQAEDLQALDAVSGGQLLGQPSLGERLAAAGKTLAVVSAGSTGAGLLLHHRAEPLGQFRWSSHGTQYSTPSAASAFARFGEVPKAALPNTARIDHAMTVFIEQVLGEIGPDVALFWSSDPDSTYHYRGIGSPEAKAAIRGADAAFGRLLAWWEETGAAAGTQIICLSDHGHITGREKLETGDLMRGAGFKAGPALDADTDVAITPGAPVGLVCRDPAALDRVAAWIVEQPWCGLLFSASRNEIEGEVAGSFALSLAAVDHARAPDLFFTFADDDETDANGIAGTGVYDNKLPLLGGIHGGLHPRELNNVLIAGGDAFREGYGSPFAAGIIDVLPTVLHLLGVPAKGVDGRVLIEAMSRGATPGEARKVSHEVGTGGFARRLDRHLTGNTPYLDGGHAA